jgi:tRNA threonylcarbamoyladenosine biosynthesis protein TsaE
MNRTHITGSVEETIAFARKFGEDLQRGDVVALYGDLGCGKTQFVKGVCQSWNIHDHATSPSFVILNRYQGVDKGGGEMFLYHFDLYRIKSIDEMYDIGYEEYLQKDGICLIEWAEMFGELLPDRRFDVSLSFGALENERRIEISEIGDR